MRVYFDLGSVSICCVYLPPNDAYALSCFLNSLYNIISTNPDEILLIFGDFNLPEISWTRSFDARFIVGSSSSARSNDVLDCFSFCGLTQFCNLLNASANVLDYVLSNARDSVDIVASNFRLVLEDASHPPIEAIFAGARAGVRASHYVSRRDFRSADYESLNRDLGSADWGALLTDLDVESAVCKFYLEIDILIDRYVPIKNRSSKSSFPHWFSLPTIRAIREKLKWHKKWKRIGMCYLLILILLNQL